MASSSEKKNYRATLNQADEKKRLNTRKSHARFDISFEFQGTYKQVRFARIHRILRHCVLVHFASVDGTFVLLECLDDIRRETGIFVLYVKGDAHVCVYMTSVCVIISSK